jgi:hypothetical protein
MNKFIALTVAGVLAIGVIALSGNQDEASARGCSGPRLGGRCGGAAADCCAPERVKRDRCSGRLARRCGGEAASCCEPAPAPCCEPAPSCEPDPCGCGGRQGLLARLKARRCAGASDCCEPAACGCGVQGCTGCGADTPVEATEEATEEAPEEAAEAAEASIRSLTLRFVAFR